MRYHPRILPRVTFYKSRAQPRPTGRMLIFINRFKIRHPRSITIFRPDIFRFRIENIFIIISTSCKIIILLFIAKSLGKLCRIPIIKSVLQCIRSWPLIGSSKDIMMRFLTIRHKSILQVNIQMPIAYNTTRRKCCSLCCQGLFNSFIRFIYIIITNTFLICTHHKRYLMLSSHNITILHSRRSIG